jgi:1-acyl-sn-glycerol-3-phosphate acyltransferase
MSTWTPVSVCTLACLPRPAAVPRTAPARTLLRVCALIGLLLAAACGAPVLPLLAPARRSASVRLLSRAALRACGVRLVHLGEPGFAAGGDRGVLVVANHLSWLDIVALAAVQPPRMLAKREIRDWPVIGALAARLGTLFIDRAALRALPAVVDRVASVLADGRVVALFPEGTTWCGAASGRFRRAGFQAAIDAGVPVRPAALRMRLPDGSPTSVGAFLGEDTLAASLWRVLRLPGLTFEVHVLPALAPDLGLDRRELAGRAQAAIARALALPEPERHSSPSLV